MWGRWPAAASGGGGAGGYLEKPTPKVGAQHEADAVQLHAVYVALETELGGRILLVEGFVEVLLLKDERAKRKREV